MIYKICPLSIWRKGECEGSFSGAGIDQRDGYIHFSTAVQLRETAVRHFAGQDGLVLVAVDESVPGTGQDDPSPSAMRRFRAVGSSEEADREGH
jgi:uncharacterized protein (DUF952 family)